MKTRTLTALVIVALALAAFYFGKTAFLILLPILLAMSQHEVLSAFQKAGRKISIWPVYLISLIISPAVYSGGIKGAAIVFIIAFMYQMSLIMLGDDPSPERIVAGSLSVFYPALPVAFMLILAAESETSLGVLACGAFSAAGSDTFGLFIGSKFGKKRLCPSLSPKKSMEGAVAGLFGGVIFSVIIKYIIEFAMGISLPLLLACLIGLVGAAFSVLGDLFASGIKRLCGIKDFSSLLPGHGGVTDRFDSIYFSTLGAYIVWSIISML